MDIWAYLSLPKPTYYNRAKFMEIMYISESLSLLKHTSIDRATRREIMDNWAVVKILKQN